MKLQGKNALITGGGTGIGLGIARALASEGCQVAITGRRADVLREAAAGSSPPLLHHDCNVAERDSVNELFAWASEALGPID
ncbi:MAG: SDR family NAD(P)-dependent oxidoreductase, partial [Pirellulaceae bacterium]|nr:SDR family NAD(P)-dependent oxidoreductase [Pirellulaceae bacterium]